MKTHRQKVRTRRGHDVLITAALSDDGVFRFALGRVWDDLTPAACFVTLCPTPDETEVVAAAERHARALGCGGVLIVGLHAVIADPSELLLLADPVGPDNAGVCKRIIDNTQPAFVIAAWGSHPMAKVASPAWIALVNRELLCLGHNIDGSPKTLLQATGAPSLEQYA